MIERKDAKWRRAAEAWVAAEAVFESAKNTIIKLAKGECCYGAGVKHLKSPQAGKVSYKDVPQLKGVDLEPYRGKGYFKTTVSRI